MRLNDSNWKKVAQDIQSQVNNCEGVDSSSLGVFTQLVVVVVARMTRDIRETCIQDTVLREDQCNGYEAGRERVGRRGLGQEYLYSLAFLRDPDNMRLLSLSEIREIAEQEGATRIDLPGENDPGNQFWDKRNRYGQ